MSQSTTNASSAGFESLMTAAHDIHKSCVQELEQSKQIIAQQQKEMTQLKEINVSMKRSSAAKDRMLRANDDIYYWTSMVTP